MNDLIWSENEFAVLSTAFAILLVAMEVGFRLGFRQRHRDDESMRSHLAALEAALLGLLALLLGFTFAMAVSRYDARKALVTEEANAIGTAYLQAMLLPEPRSQRLREGLREHVAARLEFFDAGLDPVRLEAAYVRAARIERALWKAVAELAASDPLSVPLGLFIGSLNDVVDLGERRRVALENHVPEIVIYLLVAASVVAVGFIAY